MRSSGHHDRSLGAPLWFLKQGKQETRPQTATKANGVAKYKVSTRPTIFATAPVASNLMSVRVLAQDQSS
jgi:hypothetical protein